MARDINYVETGSVDYLWRIKMFEFTNEDHYMNTCRKFVNESYHLHNNDIIAKEISILAKRLWKFCYRKEDYMDYCKHHGIYPAINKFTLDLKYAESREDIRNILSNFYFRDPKLNEEFEIYKGVGVIKDLMGKYGVYKIFDKNKKLVYIGKSINLGTRLPGSLKEKRCLFFSFALTNSKSDVNLYEAYYISKYKPDLNVDSKYDDDVSVELPDLEFSDILHLRDFISDKTVVEAIEANLEKFK